MFSANLDTDCQSPSLSILPYTVNFVYKEVDRSSSNIICYIYTPANLDTYGLDLDTQTGELYFKARWLLWQGQ